MKFFKAKSFCRSILLIFAFATNSFAMAASPTFVYSINGTSGDKYNVSTIFVDLFDASANRINNLKKQKKTVICYFSAGSAENWRTDYKKYPTVAKGKDMSGWSGEYWVDYRNPTVMSILINRIKLAKSKGCNGIDPDNVDGYLTKTGFPLTKSDQRNLMNKLSTTAKSEGLLIGLKNSSETAADLVGITDFVVVEQCEEYKECSKYKSFGQNNKPIYQIEYRAVNATMCANAKKFGASLIFANLALTQINFCN